MNASLAKYVTQKIDNYHIALTISPPYRHSSKLRGPDRQFFDQDQNDIKTILKYNRIKVFTIYPEFSEKGRLHYHGILKLDKNQYIRFFKHAKNKLALIGLVDFKVMETIQDLLKWEFYIRKQWFITQEILEITRPIWSNKIVLNENQNKKKDIIKETIIPINLLDYFNN